MAFAARWWSSRRRWRGSISYATSWVIACLKRYTSLPAIFFAEDEVRPDQPVHALHPVEVGVGRVVNQKLELPSREFGAEHRCELQDLRVGGAQRVDARAQDRLDGVGDWQATAPLDAKPGILLPRPAAVEQRLTNLFDEESIAPRVLVHRLGKPCWERAAREQRLGEASRIGRGERGKIDAGCRGGERNRVARDGR